MHKCCSSRPGVFVLQKVLVLSRVSELCIYPYRMPTQLQDLGACCDRLRLRSDSRFQDSNVQHELITQDTAGCGAERLSPGKGRLIPTGVLGDVANRDGGASPTRATPRLGKRKNVEVRTVP